MSHSWPLVLDSHFKVRSPDGIGSKSTALPTANFVTAIDQMSMVTNIQIQKKVFERTSLGTERIPN